MSEVYVVNEPCIICLYLLLEEQEIAINRKHCLEGENPFNDVINNGPKREFVSYFDKVK